MTMPTTGSSCSSTRASWVRSVLGRERERGIDHAVCQVAGRRRRADTHLGRVVAQGGDVAELAPGPLPLAVPMDLHVRPVRHEVVHPLVEAGPVPVRGAGRTA